MMISNDYLFFIIRLFILFIQINGSIQKYKIDPEFGSTIIFPPCLSTSISLNNELTTILFKSDSGELLTMNGKLISNNPRYTMKNIHSSELIINSIEYFDEGQYECRTDEIINYILQLIVVNSSTIHLSILEGSNITLECAEKGMWIIEETHRGGPIRTQYTTELSLINIQRDDIDFKTVTCSTHDGHHKRKYLIDVTYKPTVKLMMLTTGRLMCIICAHPLPYRIQWWWGYGGKQRQDGIDQTNINQSCIAEQFTLVWEKEDDLDQMIICEAENIYGIHRDSFQFKRISTKKNVQHSTKQTIITSSNILLTSSIVVRDEPSSSYRFLPFSSVSFILIICTIFYVVSPNNQFHFI